MRVAPFRLLAFQEGCRDRPWKSRCAPCSPGKTPLQALHRRSLPTPVHAHTERRQVQDRPLSTPCSINLNSIVLSLHIVSCLSIINFRSTCNCFHLMPYARTTGSRPSRVG